MAGINRLEITVIMPAFNAERFIDKAISSVLIQKDVAEIIIINDGSTDGTREIVLSYKDERIKLLEHERGLNRGRSTSRNLGIKKARSEFIAFLDADDYYLHDRFLKDIDIFNKNPDADGIYNAVGFEIYDLSKSYLSQVQKLYTVNKVVQPSDLFEGLVTGKVGHFQIDGLTVKKSLFQKTGLFNENLEVAEDSDIFWKMALIGKLYTGQIDKPVAIRGVHEANSFYQEHLYAKYTFEMYNSLISWSSRKRIPLKKLDLLLKWVWILKHKKEDGLWNEMEFWARQFCKSPRIIYSYLFIKYFPIVRRRKLLFPYIFRK